MRLRAWRDAWLWIALSACGGASPSTTDATAPSEVHGVTASIFDAPPLANATYVATWSQGDFGHHAEVALEHGSLKCHWLVELLVRDTYGGPNQPPMPPDATKTCDMETAKLLTKDQKLLFVIDAQGKRWMSADEVLKAASPIDTPAKAVLAVWLTSKYDLGWFDGKREYGSLEGAHVQEIAGGFEVLAGASSEQSSCGGPEGKQTVTNYKLTLFVDAAGTVTEREKKVSNKYDVADPCHPMGRRPSGFVDVASGGSVRGHLVRAMHHEAESVRAFTRIARELEAHGAPEELVTAAKKAAADERRHADLCGKLTSEKPEIAHDDLPIRSLLELAIDNAREGCVGETYSALANVVQARDAATPELRAHFAAIAPDEIDHAALAYAIAEWIADRLNDEERGEVRDAIENAVGDLARTCRFPSTEAVRSLGVPRGDGASGLFECVARAALVAA